RMSSLPPACGVHHFKHGISLLTQVSGTERKHIARILLSCLVGKIEPRGIVACRSLLHFIQLAQYPSHDEETLSYMQQELDTWHTNRSFFILQNIRDDFNIPKYHSLLHYIESIRWLGTTDNYNTEAFEHLHIDFAKQGWRASNKRDHFPQMVKWLSRQEKVASYDFYRSWMDEFYADEGGDDNKGGNAEQEQEININSLPFSSLDVWHQLKFRPFNLSDNDSDSVQEVIKVIPISKHSSIPRFDTVLVLDSDEAESTAVQGCRVGCLRVIFCLPRIVLMNGFPVSVLNYWPTEFLAYVTWYMRFQHSPDKNTGMYHIEAAVDSKGQAQGSIITLSDIRQCCMLMPSRGLWNESWTSSNILDQCSSFFMNNLQSKYTYQTIY
ncbi:hypothetical protein GYMLUDRAFT_181672, partial [Collybiopsis luxurians FD-317 M1]